MLNDVLLQLGCGHVVSAHTVRATIRHAFSFKQSIRQKHFVEVPTIMDEVSPRMCCPEAVEGKKVSSDI